VSRRSPTKSSAQIRIRSARSSDLDALVELENRVFVSDRISPRQLRRHLGSSSVRILVATGNREVVAAAVVFVRANSRIARLYSIAVAPQARGLGIGARLLTAAEKCARGIGRETFRLEVRVENSAARTMYERRGYRLVGYAKKYYEDRQDAVRYEKTLMQPKRRKTHTEG
jgi:ribosomal-protein-alanine N-acetyltransferase